jgi:hypothetical protein
MLFSLGALGDEGELKKRDFLSSNVMGVLSLLKD